MGTTFKNGVFGKPPPHVPESVISDASQSTATDKVLSRYLPAWAGVDTSSIGAISNSVLSSTPVDNTDQLKAYEAYQRSYQWWIRAEQDRQLQQSMSQMQQNSALWSQSILAGAFQQAQSAGLHGASKYDGKKADAINMDDIAGEAMVIPNPTLVSDKRRILVRHHSFEDETRELNDSVRNGWRVIRIEPTAGFGSEMHSVVTVQRESPKRSEAMRSGAVEQSCVNCGAKNDTVKARHYHGIRETDFGRRFDLEKQGEEPVNDLVMADLCETCHQEMTSGSGSFEADPVNRRISMSERFMYCVMMTILRRAEQGILTVKE